MMRCDSPAHHHNHLRQELVVDCDYTKVIARRVGAFGASLVRAAKPGDFIRTKPPRDNSYAAAAGSYIPSFPMGKLREFTLAELEKATWNFSRERVIGRGGFGEIFKGILSDGEAIAVKVLAKDSREGLEQFQAEMEASCAITSSSHPNLVPAIGYHSSKRKNVKVMIVYPFMSNRDLGRYLGDRQPSQTLLDWPTRKRIALGVARGISSLHELGIVHRDIKPSNILLDDEFNAHVGDLGLAKSVGLPCNSYYAARFLGDDTCYTTRLVGTFGYLAREYLRHSRCSRKSDVYAFGVTLIQLVTGKAKFDEGGKRMPLSILYMAEQLFKNEEDLTRHVHPNLLGMHAESEAIELIQLGLVCAQYDPEKRPPMSEVIAVMEGSRVTLKQRWDNYDCPWNNRRMSFTSDNQSATAEGSGHGSRDDDDYEEVSSAFEFDINEEELEEIGEDGKQLQLQQYQGYRSGVSCCDSSVHLRNASSAISGAELISPAGLRSQEDDILNEIVEVNPSEGGNSKPLSSQANRYKGQSDEVATKLKEMLDQMRAMESNHQVVMEEMNQRQIAIMQSMMKMQEQ